MLKLICALVSGVSRRRRWLQQFLKYLRKRFRFDGSFFRQQSPLKHAVINWECFKVFFSVYTLKSWTKRFSRHLCLSHIHLPNTIIYIIQVLIPPLLSSNRTQKTCVENRLSHVKSVWRKTCLSRVVSRLGNASSLGIVRNKMPLNWSNWFF